jgi:hypothetical protein
MKLATLVVAVIASAGVRTTSLAAQAPCDAEPRARCIFERDGADVVIDWLLDPNAVSWVDAEDVLEAHKARHGWGYSIRSVDLVPKRSAVECPPVIVDLLADLAQQDVSADGGHWTLIELALVLQRNGRIDEARRALAIQLDAIRSDPSRERNGNAISALEERLAELEHCAGRFGQALEHQRRVGPVSGMCGFGAELDANKKSRDLVFALRSAEHWTEVEEAVAPLLFSTSRFEPEFVRVWIDAELALGHARTSAEVLASAAPRVSRQQFELLEAAERSWRLAQLDDGALLPRVAELLRGDSIYTGRVLRMVIESGPATIEALSWVFDTHKTLEQNRELAAVLALTGTPCIGRALERLKIDGDPYDTARYLYSCKWERANSTWLLLTAE